jgi:hypothetical protein
MSHDRISTHNHTIPPRVNVNGPRSAPWPRVAEVRVNVKAGAGRDRRGSEFDGVAVDARARIVASSQSPARPGA